MTKKTLRQRKGHKEIDCSFCKGKGTDPFGILSPQSSCPVCNGRCRIMVETPLQKCAFCDSSGAHPYTRMTCSACLGKGVITMPKPVRKCPECSGSGTDTHHRMPCSLCRGAGVLQEHIEPPAAKEKVASAKRP